MVLNKHLTKVEEDKVMEAVQVVGWVNRGRMAAFLTCYPTKSHSPSGMLFTYTTSSTHPACRYGACHARYATTQRWRPAIPQL